MLGARNSSQIDTFFTGGRHESLDVFYIRKSYFGLPRQNIKNNSDRTILFERTFKHVESMNQDIGGYDMAYCKFKQMCRNAWSEKFNYPSYDMVKNKNDGKCRRFNE